MKVVMVGNKDLIVDPMGASGSIIAVIFLRFCYLHRRVSELASRCVTTSCTPGGPVSL